MKSGSRATGTPLVVRKASMDSSLLCVVERVSGGFVACDGQARRFVATVNANGGEALGAADEATVNHADDRAAVRTAKAIQEGKHKIPHTSHFTTSRL